MAPVTIDSGPVTADLYLNQVPPDKWHALMLARRTFLHTSLPYDCRRLLEFVDDAKKMCKPLGFKNVKDFVERGFDLDFKQVRWAIEGLIALKPDEAIPYRWAQELGKRAAKVEEEDLANLRPRGKAGHNVYNKKNVINIRPHGTSAAAAHRRLRKDRPDIHKRVMAGEITAHAGMVEAGFRKKSISKKMSNLEHIQKLWHKLNKEERYAHLHWTLKQCATCGGSNGNGINGMNCDRCCNKGMREAGIRQ